jgi:hypothetical protein
MSSLLYISILYDLGTSMELNPLPIAPLVLKFDIHLGQAGRKGVRRGEEEEWSVPHIATTASPTKLKQFKNDKG